MKLTKSQARLIHRALNSVVLASDFGNVHQDTGLHKQVGELQESLRRAWGDGEYELEVDAAADTELQQLKDELAAAQDREAQAKHEIAGLKVRCAELEDKLNATKGTHDGSAEF